MLPESSSPTHIMPPTPAKSDAPRAGLTASAPDPLDLPVAAKGTLYAGHDSDKFHANFANWKNEFETALAIAKPNFKAKLQEIKSKTESAFPDRGAFLDSLGDSLSRVPLNQIPWLRQESGEYEILAKSNGWNVSIRILVGGSIGDIQFRQERKK